MPFGIDFGVELNASIMYYRGTDQLISNVDFGGTGGGGVKLPFPGQIDVTTGPVLGWAASNPYGGNSSAGVGASVAAEGAVATSLSVPLTVNAKEVEFYVDPHYGQVPTTVYFGVGVGCCGAGGNLSGSKSIYNDDLSILLPWHWR